MIQLASIDVSESGIIIIFALCWMACCYERGDSLPENATLDSQIFLVCGYLFHLLILVAGFSHYMYTNGDKQHLPFLLLLLLIFQDLNIVVLVYG